MTDPAELRTALKTFLGRDQYKKFIEQGLRLINHGEVRRLAFWQEVAWSKFVSAQPQFSVSLAELREILRICPLHEIEFETEVINVFHGCVDYSMDYIKERNLRFPWAGRDIVSDEGAHWPDQVSIWFCVQCREIYDAREAKRNSRRRRT